MHLRSPRVRGSLGFDILPLTADNLGRCEELKIKYCDIELNAPRGKSESLANVPDLSEYLKIGEKI